MAVEELFESLFGFIMVVVAIISAIAKNNKKKTESIRKRAASPNHPSVEQTLAEWFNAPQPAASTAAEPAPAVMVPDPAPVPKQVAQPRVQTSVAVKERPAVVVGSMGVDTHEGLHPCDDHNDEPMRDPKPLAPVAVEKPGIQLDWNGDNLVKAFIMQEVLTRPADRRRRA